MIKTNSAAAAARPWIMPGMPTAPRIGVSGYATTRGLVAVHATSVVVRSADLAPRFVVNQSHPPRDVLR